MGNTETLDTLRQEIDGIDSAILDLLARRREVVGRVALTKAELGLEPVQPARYQQMVERLRTEAEERDVNPELVENIWHAIHEDSVAQQASTSSSSVIRG